VGGGFDSIGGQSRSYIAALDATTGNALAWNPNASGYGVYALVVSGTTVFAGGWFDSIGGQNRSNIAALDATTGNALAWNPNAIGNNVLSIQSLAVSGTIVYAGGYFSTIGGQSRNNIAALDATTGNALPWNPNANSRVLSLAVSGTTVYAGGYLNSIGGLSRNYIAALDATTGKATAWNPNADSIVRTLVVNGTTVYAGGGFASIGGQSRNFIAALDATTGNSTSWNPIANGVVRTLAVSGTMIYAGGVFDSIGGQRRNYVAALDMTTGNATNWNPKAHSPSDIYTSPVCVYSLAVSGTTVYVGGGFDSIGGQGRNNIAALNMTTGNAIPWNPDANGIVRTLTVSGTKVYAGGLFTYIGGQNRGYIAALDATTGNALAWDPYAILNNWNSPCVNSGVTSFAASGTTVYSGGDFASIGGQNRSFIAALNVTTGNALAWNPNANITCYPAAENGVLSLAVSGTTVYAGGRFTSIGQGVGAGHPYFAQFDSSYQSPVIQPVSASSGAKNTCLQIIGSNSRSSALVKFAYALPKAEHVSLRLYSLNGQLQSELVNKHQDAGNYSLNMQRGTLATGTYLVVFRAGEYHQERMISLMK
jgi:predicted small secreted protein